MRNQNVVHIGEHIADPVVPFLHRLVESEIHLGEILEVLLPSDDMIPFVPWGNLPVI
jgi:hypothetical protein